MVLGTEGIGDGEQFALWQDGEEEAQSLQENLRRHLTLFQQLRRKQQILRGRTDGAAFIRSTGVHVV